MKSRDMKTGVREILHDVDRAYATASRFFDTDEILRRLNEAKPRICVLLRAMPNTAWCAISRLVKRVPIADGGTVATDFYELLATSDDNSRYIPVAPLPVAAPLQPLGHDYSYVQSGIYHGTGTSMTYFAWAKETIQDSSNALTEFSDGVYFLIQLLAARECLPQEKSDALDRWKLLTQFIAEEIASFGGKTLAKA